MHVRTLLPAVLLLFLSIPAAADPHITATASDSVLAGLYYTTYTIDFVGPANYCDFVVSPAPPQNPDSVVGCGAPSGWICGGFGSNAVKYTAFGPCVGNGAHVAGFQVWTTAAAPCLEFLFHPEGTGPPLFVAGCLTVGGPTPARATTW